MNVICFFPVKWITLRFQQPQRRPLLMDSSREPSLGVFYTLAYFPVQTRAHLLPVLIMWVSAAAKHRKNTISLACTAPVFPFVGALFAFVCTSKCSNVCWRTGRQARPPNPRATRFMYQKALPGLVWVNARPLCTQQLSTNLPNCDSLRESFEK